jgi:hypothetical protein
MIACISGTVVALALSASNLASADANSAHADTDAAHSRADALFTAARQLRDAGLYEDACPKFAETEAIEPGVGIMLYLADCYQHTGHSASAWAEFRKAEQLARDRNDKRAEVAKARADALEAKLTRMTLVGADHGKHPGLTVAVDGTRIRPDNLNATLPTDPGTHAVKIDEPGQPPLAAHPSLWRPRAGPWARLQRVGSGIPSSFHVLTTRDLGRRSRDLRPTAQSPTRHQQSPHQNPLPESHRAERQKPWVL